MKSVNFQPYTTKCICPCSKLFNKWHRKDFLDKLPNWSSCNSEIYEKTRDFIEHLHVMSKDYYHRIILRVVQSNYSSILAKFRFQTCDDTKLGSDTLPFSSIHKGTVTLPPYIISSADYESFDYINDRDGTKISLSKTNLLVNSSEKVFIPFFSENSFSNTLQRLIKCGEYIKTKKRSTPMYCFGSTIMCTRFPKFFCEGKPQILPRPYHTSKPGSKGYEIIRSPWMQSFLKEVEYHILHYLHNMCEDKALRKMTLFNIELARKIIPECLRLGDTFFTHMIVF